MLKGDIKEWLKTKKKNELVEIIDKLDDHPDFDLEPALEIMMEADEDLEKIKDLSSFELESFKEFMLKENPNEMLINYRRWKK